ncbi:transcriptional regulator, GntR family [Glycomyces sambucus]|uniref:Transcriptional regulator, GntR family n=1 Tax=Glycomyces sambucus TaxID=380244 RepID=A0A1G9D580_9ACTN|nr:GntR family transcriptional regulator [Glycomyces sambucus]SDK58854.1 transcriptional regulator, GntR family [Glycomyces sambucus]
MDTVPFGGPAVDLAASAPALAALVADRLRDMITHGGLAPGERLKEAELAAALHVSRGPVREAIALLTAEGLVETQRYRGARVISLTARDIEEVYSLRLAIERLAMARAAERLTPELRAALDGVLDRMRDLPETAPAADVAALDLEFHDLVYEAAAHARLDRTWAPIRGQVAVFLHSRTDGDYFRSTSHAKHLRLRDALATGDPAAAVAAIEDHIGWVLLRLAPSHIDTPHDRSPNTLKGTA